MKHHHFLRLRSLFFGKQQKNNCRASLHCPILTPSKIQKSHRIFSKLCRCSNERKRIFLTFHTRNPKKIKGRQSDCDGDWLRLDAFPSRCAGLGSPGEELMLIRAAEEAPKGPASAFPAACVRLSGLIRKRLMDLMDNFIPSYFISLSPPSPLASLGRHKHGSLCTGGRLCCEREIARRA